MDFGTVLSLDVFFKGRLKGAVCPHRIIRLGSTGLFGPADEGIAHAGIRGFLQPVLTAVGEQAVIHGCIQTEAAGIIGIVLHIVGDGLLRLPNQEIIRDLVRRELPGPVVSLLRLSQGKCITQFPGQAVLRDVGVGILDGAALGNPEHLELRILYRFALCPEYKGHKIGPVIGKGVCLSGFLILKGQLQGPLVIRQIRFRIDHPVDELAVGNIMLLHIVRDFHLESVGVSFRFENLGYGIFRTSLLIQIRIGTAAHLQLYLFHRKALGFQIAQGGIGCIQLGGVEIQAVLGPLGALALLVGFGRALRLIVRFLGMGQGDFIEGYVVTQAQHIAGVNRDRDTQRAGDLDRFILGPGVVQLQLQRAFSGSNALNAM